MTPRSIRAFVLRYQLLRLLLQHLKEGVDAGVLIRCLAARMHPASSKPKIQVNPIVRAAVDSVIGDD